VEVFFPACAVVAIAVDLVADFPVLDANGRVVVYGEE
jgi:hypothetical protein